MSQPQAAQAQQQKPKFNVYTIEECPACGQKTKRAFQSGDYVKAEFKDEDTGE